MVNANFFLSFDTIINGVTNDYSQTKNSDIAVITSGILKAQECPEELIY